MLGNPTEREDTVQYDLMAEIQHYDDKLKEKDKIIDKLKQNINIKFHLVHELQELNEMFTNLKKEEIQDSMADSEDNHERIRHESFDVPNLSESLEPETMPDFVQIQEVQKLKENIATLIKEKSKAIQKNDKDCNDTIAKDDKPLHNSGKDKQKKEKEKSNLKTCLNASTKLQTTKSHLQIQEERTKQAFLENEEAEKETERKMKNLWTEDDSESVENLTEKVKRELELSDHLDRTLFSTTDTSSSGIGNCASLESGLENLSQHIVNKLLVKICNDGNQAGSSSVVGRSRLQAYLPISDIRPKKGLDEEENIIMEKNGNSEIKDFEERLGQKTIEVKQLEENFKFKLQQEKFHIAELQTAISEERHQSLNVMEKLNCEKQSKLELQEEMYSLQDEIGSLQTQLLRHRDEIEELSSLYEAEKLQNCVLEEALKEEKDNFNKMTTSLDEERQRSKEVSMRDSDTIMDLRTALEVKKENVSRLGLDSPLLGKKSNNGSRMSLFGSRQSLPGHKSPSLLIPGVKIESEERIIDELLEERNRCDRLRECLEIEREKSARLAETTEAEVQELLEQVRQRDEQLVQASRRLVMTELEKTQLLRELENNKEKVEKLVTENKAMEYQQKRKRTPDKENLLYDAFYIEDLESKLEAYRVREEDLQHQLDELKKTGNPLVPKSIFPMIKSSSFGGSIKNIPLEPQEQAIFFFRKLLRAESYRKALVWQKRYLSLLLSSYQESEMLSLGRLARMSGARQMLVADIPRPQGINVQFRVVVHAIISISRMKFLVKRWKKTKKTVKKAWSQDPAGGRPDSEMSGVELNRQTTEELEPDFKFSQK